MACPPLLDARALRCEREGRPLWRDLNLRLLEGDRLALVAPSGTGKTLLLRAIARLDPLANGRLWLQGADCGAFRSDAWRARVLYVSQHPHLIDGTVEDNLRWPLGFRQHRHHFHDLTELPNWLQRLNRDHSFLQQSAGHLSGGELQLVALLRALLLSPLVLLLDEFTASLDPDSTRAVESLLRHWMATRPVACLFTSHDPAQVDRLASRTLELKP